MKKGKNGSTLCVQFFFPRRTYEKNTLETTMVGMRSYGSTQKLNIPCWPYVAADMYPSHLNKVVISWCALLCGHRAFVCIQNSMSELIFILFYFTLHTDTTKFSFCLSLTYTNTHWLLPHNNNIEFNQNHFYLVQKLRQTDMHQILNRKEKWTTKSRASIWW